MEKFKPYSLSTNVDAKPTYETILQRLNKISCAHVTLREPINKNKNSDRMENNANKNNNNNHWRNYGNAVCDLPPTQTSVQQRNYRNQPFSQHQHQQMLPPIHSLVLNSHIIHSYERDRTRNTRISLFEIYLKYTSNVRNP